MAQLGEPWLDPDAESGVLNELLIPAAQTRSARALQDWDALDTKALGMLALTAALVAGLAAVHTTLNPLWGFPAAGCVVAATFMVASVWPRTVDLGPDLVDFHDEMRGTTPLMAARSMFDAISSATESVENVLDTKVDLFWISMGILSLSILGSIPVVLFRP